MRVYCEPQITPDIPKALEILELRLRRENQPSAGPCPSSSTWNKCFLFLTFLWDVWKFRTIWYRAGIQISQKRKLKGLKMGGEKLM